MKTSVLLLISISAAALITLNSNSGGPASAGNRNRTGGTNSAGTCASCHSGSTGATINISLRKKSDNSAVSGQYSPGATYVVKVSGNHPSLMGFGFQIMAAKADNTQAGSFSNLGSNYHTKVQNGITLVEQHHTLTKTGSEFVAEFDWTAPPAGTGNVNFYGTLNAVNNNGSTSGDAPSPAFNMTLAESPVHIAAPATSAPVRLYPNPASGMLHVDIGGANEGSCNYVIIDINGKKLLEGKTNADGTGAANIGLDGLAKGVYFIKIAMGTEITTIPFAKQ